MPLVSASLFEIGRFVSKIQSLSHYFGTAIVDDIFIFCKQKNQNVIYLLE